MSQQSLSITDDKELESVESYQFDWEPIRGYPELRWAGKRPFRSTRYYPAQLKESYGDPVEGWINKIFWGDNLQVMSHLLKEFRGKVQLVYIDPPFDSKADYKKQIRLRGKSVANDHSAFEEKQYSDIWSNDEYLQFMYERLMLIRELIADTGSIYVHLDQRKSHHIRCMVEEIFGIDNFHSQVVWKRTSAHSDSSTYGAVHDEILFISKSDVYIWNSPKTDYEEWYVERYYRYKDDDGRRFKSGDLSASGLSGGGYEYKWRGINGYWRCPIHTMERLELEGRIYYTANGIPRRKQYLDEMDGRDTQSWWDDIQGVVSWSDEQTRYPTQKPEALLERIIKASSNPGDIVFDCFMGSGTTQAVAMKLGRRFIGGDINLGAIDTTKKRLLSVAKKIEEKPPEIELPTTGEEEDEEPQKVKTFYTGFDYYVVNHYDVFRNPDEARDILLKALEVEPFPKTSLFHGQKEGKLVYVMPPNRIATRQDLTGIITGLDYALFEKKAAQLPPGKPVEQMTLVCMGHEPGLDAYLKGEVRSNGFEIDVEVLDVLRDRQDLQFKRDSDAEVVMEGEEVVIASFYPMNLLAKLSLEQELVEDWRELVNSVMIDFNYDGAVMSPTLFDIPEKDGLVSGRYPIPDDAGTIRIKITDLLSESWEGNVEG